MIVLHVPFELAIVRPGSDHVAGLTGSHNATALYRIGSLNEILPEHLYISSARGQLLQFFQRLQHLTIPCCMP